MCITELILYSCEYIPVVYVIMMTLIKLAVTRFVGTGGYLIGYSNGQTK